MAREGFKGLADLPVKSYADAENQCGASKPYDPSLDDLIRSAEEEERYLAGKIDSDNEKLKLVKRRLATLRTVRKTVTPEMEAQLKALRDVGVL